MSELSDYEAIEPDEDEYPPDDGAPQGENYALLAQEDLDGAPGNGGE